jgi:hypothetical protein
MGTWTRPNNRSSVVIDGMTFNIGDLMGAGLDPFDNLSSRAVMDALARHNQAKNIFNLNPLFLGTRPEDTYQEEVVDLNADTTASDLLSTIDPSLASVAANTGPFVTDPDIADVDDKETGLSSKTPEAILAEYSNKDRADPVTDMLGDYKQEDGTNFPVNVLLEIISDYAINRNNKDAQVILGKWNDKVAANQSAAAANQAGVNAGGVAGANGAAGDNGTGGDVGADTGAGVNSGTPTGSTPQGQAGTPQGGTPPAGGQPQGGGIDDNKKTGDPDDTGIGLPPISDQPINVPSTPMSTPRQPEKKAGMIIEIAQSNPIVETVLDDYLYPPMFRELNNVKQSPFSTALLFSNGLMGSFV